jgi:hypothetical protein
VAVHPLRETAIMLRARGPAGAIPEFTCEEECRVSWLDAF